MKRKLALFLSIMMIISLFQGINIYAAPPSSEFIQTHRFARTQEGLYERVGTGMEKKVMPDGTQESAFKWEMQQGEYELTYDMISSKNTTNKVRLGFEVLGEDVKVDISLRDALGAPQTVNYTQSIFPYSSSSTTTTGSNFTYTLGINPKLAERRELSLIADNTHIRMYMEGKTIHFWTSNIRKGYITDFTLAYGTESQTITVLNGLRDFEISPIHLVTTGAALASKDIIEVNDGLKPGSNPGVRVSFEKPKKVQGGQFQPISSNGETATLAIWGEQRPGVKDTTRINNERNLSFALSNGAVIKDTVKNPPVGENVGNAYDDGNTVTIYITKERPVGTGADTAVIWDSLDASMLIGGKLELTGGVFNTIKNTTFTPQNNGHTYLEYTVYRASEEQICIEIVPYNINGTVNYTLKERLGGTGSQGNFSNIITRTHTRTEENKNDIISIYIPKTKADVYYQIEVDIGTSSKLNSQQLRFMPGLSIAPPPITQILRANNVYVIPPDTTTGSTLMVPQAIGFDIEWSAPSSAELEAMLAKGDIYYELSLYDKKKESPYVTKVFRVYKDLSASANEQIKIAIYGGTPYNAEAAGQYNKTTGTFEVKRVVVQKAEETRWERLDLAPERFTNKQDYPVITENAIRVDLDYSIPGTYYLSMKGILDPDDGSQNIAVSKESSFMSLALDYAIEVLPTPSDITTVNQSVTSGSNYTISYDIQIENLDIRKYVRNMLEPAKIYLDDPTGTSPNLNKGIYEIFLYQKNASKQSYTQTDLENAMNTPENVVRMTDLKLGNKLDMSQYAEKLRKGEVLAVEYIANALEGRQQKENLLLENLDPNQVYYVKVRLRIDPLKGDALSPLSSRYSIFSSTYTFTTVTTPQPPKPEDKVPPAPKSIWVDSQPNNTTAVLKWAKAEFEQDEDTTKIYYELIRMADVGLKENEKGNKIPLSRLVADHAGSSGFYTSEPNIMTIRGSAAASELQPVQSSDSFRLEDNSLSPNTIYYYYVRTVCVIKGELVRSEWIMVPVTTQPVEKPIKLQVEIPTKYPYNPKTETVISFLAPIPPGANVPNDYEFEIAVQSEMEDSYRHDYAKTALTSVENTALIPAGYRHFVYKIYDLKPGKRYDIKVRIVDKTGEKPVNGDYPRSLYSDKVIARTEFDQDDQDKDNKFNEYLKRYDDEVEKLRRKAFWEEEAENRFSTIYKYRESYVNAEMAVQNIYELQTLEGMNRVTYYFPASMLDKASDLNVVLQAALGNESISIRPYTLTSGNEAIKEAIYQKNQKKIKDYYIKLDFLKMSSIGRINGEDVLSPEISIDLDIVYLDQEDILIEDNIMIVLNSLIDRERKRIITQLEKELARGTINEDKLKDIIDKAVANIKDDHLREVKRILKKERYKDALVKEIEKPILITSILDSYAVNGYYLEGYWSSVEVLQANGGFGIEAYKLGIYAFTGKMGIGNVIPGMAVHQNMISKYNLTDFFALDPYMIKTGTTKKQLYGAVARILGAKRNTDYTEYLKARGIKGITSIGMDKVIRQDEAVYIVMQAYEKIYNRPIGTIQIKNKQSVKNIGAFQTQYRPYVYAAVELKIIQNPNANVLPSKQISVEETIKMLSGIVPK